MLEKFIQNNKAENIRKWLDTVDLESADILQVEREIYAALAKSNRKSSWLSVPVAPLAEPVDLNALVGDLFNGAQEEIKSHAIRLDDYYQLLSDINNTLKSELDSVEKIVIQATDDIQDISIVVGDENRNFFWVSDSFNSNSYVDASVSTCLVDTDYGLTTLGPTQLEAITAYEASIDREVTNGIPGSNLYIINSGKFGLVDKEPEPILEKTDTRNFGSLFDLDQSSWFEVERNFIPQKQKVKIQGRAYLFSESGEEKDIKEITSNYDWRAVIDWPDGYQDGGPDGKGRELVEWRNLETENSVAFSSASTAALDNKNIDPTVKLAFNLSLNSPTALSSIKILPFLREDSSPIIIDTLEITADGSNILVAKDLELGSNKSTTKLQREILRRTGVQLTGSLLSFPTDRAISNIRVVLSSKPAPVKLGFAHIFQDILTEYRTERNHVLWRSVNKWKEWSRRPFNQNVPKITSSYTKPGIVGSLMGVANSAYILGKVFNSVQTDRNTSAISNAAGSIGGVVSALNAAKIGGTLGSIGSWLGKAVPVVGAILALDQLVGGFFSIDKSSQVLEGRVGYDVFKGYRSAIGIRDLTLIKTKYASESIVQSVRREFPGLVNKIGLFVDDLIPEHWGPGDWITYFLSTDGITWKSVPKLTDSTLEKSLVLIEPTKSIFFKAVLKGNNADPYHSPQLKHYAIQGLPI